MVVVSSKMLARISSRAAGSARMRKCVIIRPFLPKTGAWITSRTPVCARNRSTACGRVFSGLIVDFTFQDSDLVFQVGVGFRTFEGQDT